MALRYALLAALQEEPATGYELTQRFRTYLAHVWNATHQQIYRELGKLHDEGLVTVETIAQTERPDRKQYQVSEAGEAELTRWLATPQPRPATRDPLLVKLFAGDSLDDRVMARELAELRQQCEQRLAAYREIEQTWFRDPASVPRRYRLQYLALRRGILGAQSWLAWLDEAEGEFPPTRES